MDVEEKLNSLTQDQITTAFGRFYWKRIKNLLEKSDDINLTGFPLKIYEGICGQYNPSNQIRTYADYESYYKSNFHGGCNDRFLTRYELIMHDLFPHLKMQQSFGTGKGGYKKYGVKRYIADFVDPITNTIIEIDGSSHTGTLPSLKDTIRDCFFAELGYYTVRFTNRDVLNLLKFRCINTAIEIQQERQ